MLALPVAFAASLAVASAQDSARPQAREARQDAKSGTATAGNAIKDSWLTMKVHAQFVPEESLERSDIDVETRAGVVTLNGTVASAAGKARAVALAKATEGVKSVTDNLRVVADPDADAREAGARAGAATRETGREAADKTREAGREAKQGGRKAGNTVGRATSDGWIKSKVAAQYVTETSLDNSDIDVDVKGGTVMLNGSVRTAAAKDRAAAIAKATDGVKTVKNNLKVDANLK
jgi:hyperosmotically inducible protein